MIFNKTIDILGRKISQNSPVFIIAEAGVNHNGDIEVAKKLVDVAVSARADAVKFQFFKTSNIILKDVKKAPYQQKEDEVVESQFDMLKKLEISKILNLELKSYCESCNITFLTTPFDEDSLDELDELDLPAYKISSTDITNLPFLKKVAKKGKPILLSTGMSYLSEVDLALNVIYKYNKNVLLLQCTSNYPISDDEVNLLVINTYKDHFDILTGYSDHSIGIGAAPFAVPMGVNVVEKHFTIDKLSKGPDHASSLSPEELVEFVKRIRLVEKYMGNCIKTPTKSESHTRKLLQKYLVASKDIGKGSVFDQYNIVAKRTGGVGISPILYETVLGKVATINYVKNQVIEIE